jgi:hypothetical protein
MKQVSIGLTGNETCPYKGSDLDCFRNTYGFSVNEAATVFGFNGRISGLKKIIEKDQEVLPPTLQLLMRLYLRFPETIPFPEKLTTSDFFEECLGGETAIATRFRGILFGVDRNSGYNWGKDATPINSVLAIMHAAKKLKENKHLNHEELLEVLLCNFNSTAASLNVNPLKIGSWGRKNAANEALFLNPKDVSEKAVKNRGRRVTLAKISKLTSGEIQSLSKITRNSLKGVKIYKSI